ncbi:MAG: DUF58 domain-containing protein [Spirochaetales bacterium]|nr:DUF58 domain-containing protein [Spirochaetales bacterium]MCF7937518.1 DUF58 domain-containing protein [Spirochaetales bacterium]
MSLFSLGLFRGELATLLWGAAGLFFSCYTVLIVVLARIRLSVHFNSDPSRWMMRLASDLVALGHPIAFDYTLVLPVLRFPGLQVRCDARFTAAFSRVVSASLLLHRGSNSGRCEVVPEYRGRYRSEGARLVLRDLLGLAEARIERPGEFLVSVYPKESETEPFLEIPRSGGTAAPKKRRPRPSRDLLEVRKYYPGDDTRRINWKLYAHSRELFLRKGEDRPPPQTEIDTVLLACTREHARSFPDGACIDRLAVLLLDYVEKMSRKSFRVRIFLPDEPPLLDPDGNDRERFLRLLAALDGSCGESSALPEETPEEEAPAEAPVSAGSGNLLVFAGPAAVPSVLETAVRRLRKSAVSVEDAPVSAGGGRRKLHLVMAEPPVFRQFDGRAVKGAGALHRLLFTNGGSKRHETDYRKFSEEMNNVIKAWKAQGVADVSLL